MQPGKHAVDCFGKGTYCTIEYVHRGRGKGGKCYPVSYVIAGFNPSSQCTGWEDLLVALLLGLEVGHCWDFKSLLLKDYWHGMMCAIVGGIQMGLALYEPHLSDRESNKSSLTQMSYVLGGVGGRRSREHASY